MRKTNIKIITPSPKADKKKPKKLVGNTKKTKIVKTPPIDRKEYRKPIDEELLVRMARAGLSQEKMADGLGISTHTLYERLRREPHLSQGLKKAQAQTVLEVTEALIKNAKKNADNTSMIFYLKHQDQKKWTRDYMYVDLPKNYTMQEKMAFVIDEVAAGKLDGTKGERLCALMEKVIKCEELPIKEQVAEIQEMLASKLKKK